MDTFGLRGAYGLALAGRGSDHTSLPSAQPHWPLWTVAWAADGAGTGAGAGDRIPVLGGGEVEVDAAARAVTLRGMVEPSTAALMHPWLSFICTVVTQKRGLMAFHAGGLVFNEFAWAVLGAKHAGKTTTLAWLSSRGCIVTSDDLVVLDGLVSLAGPGCLDLRAAAAAHLGMGTRETLLPGRERWRVWLPAPPSEVRFAGFIVPEWHEEVSVEEVRGQERLRLIVENRAYQAPAGHERQILELCALPMVRWRRPRDFARLPEASVALLEALRLREPSGALAP